MGVQNEERRLVERCLEGDESAHYEFVGRFQGLVFGICLRMLGDAHEAEDVAQEVFLRAMRSLGKWDRSRPLRPWILTIAVNRCRTHLGRMKKRPSLTENAEELPDLRPNEDDSNELRAELSVALLQLREDYRQVFLLFHEQGLSYEEMSEATGRPVGTLKTWLHRARGELLEHLRRKGLVPETSHDLSGV